MSYLKKLEKNVLVRALMRAEQNVTAELKANQSLVAKRELGEYQTLRAQFEKDLNGTNKS